MDVYGPLVTIEDVRAAFTTHLRTWTPAYIAEVARRAGTTMGPFRGYATETGDEFPICITACAAAEDPAKGGDGIVAATFAVGAAAVVSAATRDEATILAGRYGAAIRACVIQHPDLSGFAEWAEWDGEAIDEVAYDTGRAIVACTVKFRVGVDSVVDVNAGPATPPANPAVDPGDWPSVTTTPITIVRTTT